MHRSKFCHLVWLIPLLGALFNKVVSDALVFDGFFGVSSIEFHSKLLGGSILNVL